MVKHKVKMTNELNLENWLWPTKQHVMRLQTLKFKTSTYYVKKRMLIYLNILVPNITSLNPMNSVRDHKKCFKSK